MTEQRAIFNDLIYLDVSLAESIVAQLDEGLVRTYIDESERASGAGVEGRATLLSVLGVSGNIRSDARGLERDEWILHDYVLQKTLDLLREENLITDITNSDRRLLESNRPSFVTLKGSFDLYDSSMFSAFSDLAKIMPKMLKYDLNAQKQQPDETAQEKPKGFWDTIRHSIETSANKVPQDLQIFVDMAEFVNVLFPDLVRASFSSRNMHAVGIVKKQFLREDTRSLIYKYGLPAKKDWRVLALVTSVPDEENERDIQNKSMHWQRRHKLKLKLKREYLQLPKYSIALCSR
jgi:hypothetical protein